MNGACVVNTNEGIILLIIGQRHILHAILGGGCCRRRGGRCASNHPPWHHRLACAAGPRLHVCRTESSQTGGSLLPPRTIDAAGQQCLCCPGSNGILSM